jgi:hypothetical protein
MFLRKKPVNFTRFVVARHTEPTTRLLTHSHSLLNSRVLNSPFLVSRSRRPRSLPLHHLPHLILRTHLPASRMFLSSERLSTAWRHSPMKWNPLPWFVGALLLVVIQYRRYYSDKEVHVDEDGHEVIKLKGPWQVGVPFSYPRVLPIPQQQSPLARSTDPPILPSAGFVDRTTAFFPHGPPR